MMNHKDFTHSFKVGDSVMLIQPLVNGVPFGTKGTIEHSITGPDDKPLFYVRFDMRQQGIVLEQFKDEGVVSFLGMYVSPFDIVAMKGN